MKYFFCIKLINKKYNLINFKELLNDTCRFAIKDYDMLIKMVTGSLRLSKDYYYRLILVPINHKYKLPNYIVYDEEGIQKVKEFVASYNGYSEIWLYNDNLYVNTTYLFILFAKTGKSLFSSYEYKDSFSI